MANIAKYLDVSIATATIGFEHSLSGLPAGEDMTAGDAVYLASDGTFMLAGGSTDPDTVDSPICHGFVGDGEYYTGQPVTIFDDIRMHYGDGLTPGAPVYLSSDTAGGIADAPPWTGAVAIGYAVDEHRVYLKANWQLPAEVAVVP